MPKIFNRIDKIMKDFFEGKQVSEIAADLPEGFVKFGERWVVSQPIDLPGDPACCYIRGKFDTLVEFHDATYGVVDFKTTEVKPELVAFYSRQLHAYAYALEHAQIGSLSLRPVTMMGLLCVEPIEMTKDALGRIAYLGNAAWLECQKDEAQFLNFLEGVIHILKQPEPPAPNPNCPYCAYRDAARYSGF